MRGIWVGGKKGKGRKEEEDMKIMNGIGEIEEGEGGWRKKEGRGEKEKIVEEWGKREGEGKKVECIGDSGLRKGRV